MSPDNQIDFASIHTLLPVSYPAAQDVRFAQTPNFEMFIDLLSQPSAANRAALPLTVELNQ